MTIALSAISIAPACCILPYRRRRQRYAPARLIKHPLRVRVAVRTEKVVHISARVRRRFCPNKLDDWRRIVSDQFGIHMHETGANVVFWWQQIATDVSVWSTGRLPELPAFEFRVICPLDDEPGMRRERTGVRNGRIVNACWEESFDTLLNGISCRLRFYFENFWILHIE